MPCIFSFSLCQYHVARGPVFISQPLPTSLKDLTICDPERLDLMWAFVIDAARLAISQGIATSQKRHAISAVKADIRQKTAYSHSCATAVASQATRRTSAPVRWKRGSVLRAVELDICADIAQGHRFATDVASQAIKRPSVPRKGTVFQVA